MGYEAHGRKRLLGVAVGALIAGAAWISAPAALAAGGSDATVATNSTSEELVFNTPTVVTNQTTSFQTELIAELNGGKPLFDQTFALPFNDSTVQTGVVQARLAITTAGGPGVVFLGPTLTGQTITNTSSSATTYSFNHAVISNNVATLVGVTGTQFMSGGQLVGTNSATPLGSTIFVNGVAVGTWSNLQGMSVGGQVNAATVETVVNGVVQGPTPSFFFGATSSCAAGIAGLPSSTKPTCTTGGTPVLLSAGEVGISSDVDTTDFIDQSTVTTNNTLTSDVYTLTGTVEAFGTVRAAVADQGFDANDRFGRRLLDAGPNGGSEGSTPGDPVWLEGYGYVTRAGSAGSFPGDRADGGGVNGGLDYDFSNGFKLGVAGDYDSAAIAGGSAGEHANLALTQVGVYGGWRSGSVFAALAGTYGWGSATTTVTPTGLAMTASSRFNPSAAGVSAEAGDRLSVGRAFVTPSIGAAWSHIDSGGFTETGSALDLTGVSQAYDRYRGWLGLEAETTVNSGAGALTLRAYGRALALGGDDVIALPVAFVGGTTMMDIDGADTGGFGGDLGASADYRIGHSVHVFAAYDARLREHYVSQTASAGVKISF